MLNNVFKLDTTEIVNGLEFSATVNTIKSNKTNITFLSFLVVLNSFWTVILHYILKHIIPVQFELWQSSYMRHCID